MSALQDAAREELLAISADLRSFLRDTTPSLRARGIALAATAESLGQAAIDGVITFAECKSRLHDIADAVKSEALAAGYDTEAKVGDLLTRAATALLRIASLAIV